MYDADDAEGQHITYHKAQHTLHEGNAVATDISISFSLSDTRERRLVYTHATNASASAPFGHQRQVFWLVPLGAPSQFIKMCRLLVK